MLVTFQLNNFLKFEITQSNITWKTINRKRITSQVVMLEQCCPALSPFAICGDRRFKCGDRQLFRIGILMVNTHHIYQNLTKVANVATEIMWLDNTVLEHLKATKSWINITKNGKWSSP